MEILFEYCWHSIANKTGSGNCQTFVKVTQPSGHNNESRDTRKQIRLANTQVYKTQVSFVAIFKVKSGVPDPSIFFRRKDADRENKNLEGKDGTYLDFDVPQKTNVLKEPPPFKMKIRWGWTESIISRKTAKLIAFNDVVDSLRDWVQDVFFPEEFFYATLATLNREKLMDGEVLQGNEKFDVLILEFSLKS